MYFNLYRSNFLYCDNGNAMPEYALSCFTDYITDGYMINISK